MLKAIVTRGERFFGVKITNESNGKLLTEFPVPVGDIIPCPWDSKLETRSGFLQVSSLVGKVAGNRKVKIFWKCNPNL